MQQQTIDFDRLTGLQRQGPACVACGADGGTMTPLATPDNPDSLLVFTHATREGCVHALLATVVVVLAMLDRDAATEAGGVR